MIRVSISWRSVVFVKRHHLLLLKPWMCNFETDGLMDTLLAHTTKKLVESKPLVHSHTQICTDSEIKKKKFVPTWFFNLNMLTIWHNRINYVVIREELLVKKSHVHVIYILIFSVSNKYDHKLCLWLFSMLILTLQFHRSIFVLPNYM